MLIQFIERSRDTQRGKGKRVRRKIFDIGVVVRAGLVAQLSDAIVGMLPLRSGS